jgi:hypothetical protein
VAREGRRELAAAGAAREPPTDEASKFVPIANREKFGAAQDLDPALVAAAIADPALPAGEDHHQSGASGSLWDLRQRPQMRRMDRRRSRATITNRSTKFSSDHAKLASLGFGRRRAWYAFRGFPP